MKTLWILSFLVLPTAHADFVSPFPSRVPGLDVPNASVLQTRKDGKPLLLRAMDPTRSKVHMEQLKTLGVNDVLVFKDSPPTNPKDAADIVAKLEQAGIKAHHINMPYKDAPYEQLCEMTIQSLQLIKATTATRPLLFHCTVGEDRTGALAGLIRLLDRQKTDRVDEEFVYQTFSDEMCAFGYEAANPDKANKKDGKRGGYEGSTHQRVVVPIRKALTPLYLNLALEVIDKNLSWENLDPALCQKGIAESKLKSRFGILTPFKCEPRDPKTGLIKSNAG